jgi:hypothetical protein
VYGAVTGLSYIALHFLPHTMQLQPLSSYLLQYFATFLTRNLEARIKYTVCTFYTVHIKTASLVLIVKYVFMSPFNLVLCDIFLRLRLNVKLKISDEEHSFPDIFIYRN